MTAGTAAKHRASDTRLGYSAPEFMTGIPVLVWAVAGRRKAKSDVIGITNFITMTS